MSGRKQEIDAAPSDHDLRMLDNEDDIERGQ
jgi:hypothetical protein